MKKQGNAILSLLLCVLLVFSTAVPAFAAVGTVKGLKAATVTAESVTLKWSAVSGAKGYEVQQATSKGWTSAAVTSKTTAKIKSLQLGKTYQFRVRAYKTGKSVQYGTPSATVTVLAAPTVKTLKVSAKASNSLTLKWSKVSGASGYRLQQYVNKQWVNLLKKTTKNTYTVKKLAPNTAYKFRVCAYKDSVFGAWKELKTRTDLLPKPEALKATKVSDTALTLSWNKVPTAKQYYIYRVGTNTQKQIATTTKTTYRLTKLKAATDYMYAVRARTVVNDRNYYSQFSSNLSVRTAPKKASGLIASSVTDSAVNLKFTRVAGAEGYEIWKYSDATLKWEYIGAASGTTYTVSDLAPQTDYRFKIRAYHTVNGGKLCGGFSEECKAQTKMAPVSGLQFADATGTTLTLLWNPISSATGYRIDLRAYDEPESKLRMVNPAIQTTDKGRISATVSGLQPNTVYYLYVRPLYGAAFGAELPVVAQTAPDKVTGVKVQSAPGGISLTWPAVAGAQGYEVSRLLYADTWSTLGSTPACSFADSAVETDTIYTYRIRAFYEIGGNKYYGEPSDPASEKPLPPAVSGLAASNVSETSFLLSWNSPQTNTDYSIKLSENGGSERTLQPYVKIDGGKTTLLVEGVSAGATCTVKVYNTVNGTQSMPAVLTVTMMPGQVKGVSATALSSDAVNLNWTTVPGAEYYEIQSVSESGAAVSNIDNHVTAMPYQISGLKASTTYRFRVRAVNSNAGVIQFGVYSQPAAVTTKAASSTPTGPAAPSNLSATPTATGSTYSVALSWSGVNSVSGYRIMINDGSWRKLTDVTTTSYTAANLSAGSYSFYVMSYTGSGSSQTLSSPSNTVSLTLGNTAPTDPTTPTTPAQDLPTSSTPVKNISLTQLSDGRHFTLKWDDVSGAFYTVQMRDPKTKQWVTVREKLVNARVTPDEIGGDMGVTCSTNSDQATTVGWAAVDGATGYEVRNELAENTNDWLGKITTSATSATLRLPPNSRQNIRVSAVGPISFRIYALNSAGTSCLAYSEYTAQNAYISSCDYVHITPQVSFSSSASDGVKAAYALMLTQAVNNTRMETGKVSVTAVSEMNASGSGGGQKETDSEKKTITCQYDGGTGQATVVTQKNGKTETSKARSSLMSIIVPSDGKTYLYDQHNIATFRKYVSDVTATQSGGKTVIEIKLKQESVTTSAGLVYHPGLVGSAVTPDNLEYVKSEFALATGASATVGVSTIKATINANYTLDKLEISNPYVMVVKIVGVSAQFDTKLTYNYTFTR